MANAEPHVAILPAGSTPPASLPYRVRFYNPRKSGTWILATDCRAYADEFAGRNRIYSEPCRVEVVS